MAHDDLDQWDEGLIDPDDLDDLVEVDDDLDDEAPVANGKNSQANNHDNIDLKFEIFYISSEHDPSTSYYFNKLLLYSPLRECFLHIEKH